MIRADTRGFFIMPRNIANKPHPTPNPDKPHATGPTDKVVDAASAKRPSPSTHRPPGHESPSVEVPATDEPTYDSCFDDLNVILSQSIQQPDPDPNLESSGPTVKLAQDEDAPLLKQDRGKAPRTSEIFRSVIAASLNLAGREDQSGATVHRPGQSPPPPAPTPGLGPEGEQPGIDLVVEDRDRHDEQLASEEEDHLSEPTIAWSQVLLMSYASAITLALIWMLWTGRWSSTSAPVSPSIDLPVIDSSSRTLDAIPATAPRPIPPENRARLGQTIQLGDLEITPLTVISAPIELVRSIEPHKRRREQECLVLRLRMRNLSKEHAITPLGPELTRDRGLRPSEPYISTSQGPSIRLFPLAVDSEWAIVGQEFNILQPADTTETFVAAEPSSALNVTDEMTWRVRIQTGVYRTDMLAVPFSKAEIHPADSAARDLDGFP